MAKSYIGPGEVLKYTAGADISSGDTVIVHATTPIVGVALTDIASGDEGSVQICGIFNMAAKDTDVFAVGDKLYFHTTNNELQLSSTTAVLVGIATAAKASSVLTADVKLNSI